jgi:aryl-alcohol dehydrogenase-like predicted oxidoreductase
VFDSQQETSEMIIGEWAEARGIRDQLVIATKYTTNFKMGQGDKYPQMSSFSGNSAKALHVTVEASLKKLRTSYIDILYVHFWTHRCSIEEVMDSLHHLVASRKVLYLVSAFFYVRRPLSSLLICGDQQGISDAPAWVVSQANLYARMAHKTPFVVYQGKWNVMCRDFERDIIPMCRYNGLALAPWDVVGGGKFRTDAEEEKRKETGEKGRARFGSQSWERNDNEKKISAALEKVAKEVGTEHITAGKPF